MTLRARLTVAFALFAALPLTAAVAPVSRALSLALETEYRARLDGSARAVEGEYRRLAGEASAAARELALDPEVTALAQGRADPAFDAGEAGSLTLGWMRARGLEVLALTDDAGVVVASGHLPARAGDADPELRELQAGAPAGRPVPRELSRATAEGVESILAVVAWEEVPGATPPLRVTAGVALGDGFARRLAALTGGDVEVLAQGRQAPVARAAPRNRAQALADRFLGATRPRTRRVTVPPEGPARAAIAVTLPASGLAHAQAIVALTLLAALALAVVSASLAGHLLAHRITRPLEALAEGARRVRQGELATRVEAHASGEVGELVEAFNAMTAELLATTARAAAAERVAAWREVARRLAHEVKNPLTPVAMSVETLREAWARRRPDFGALFEEGTLAISEEVRRLVRIVDAFSRFARLPAPEKRPVAAAELLESALALYPDEQGGVRLVRALEPDLPTVSVDRDQVLQVVHNLVKNALEALAPAGRGTVRVGARTAEGGLSLTVSDDGPGVRPEDLPHLFEPYFTTKEGGTGLGLAIADRIAGEHGGRLEVASTPGACTTFTLWLPMA